MVALATNTTGLGERRAAKTGTLGRVPVENILGDVLAAPNQDAFAAGSDSCFLVIHPDMKTGGANMWTYWVRGMPIDAGGLVSLFGRVTGRALQRAPTTESVVQDKRCLCYIIFVPAALYAPVRIMVRYCDRKSHQSTSPYFPLRLS